MLDHVDREERRVVALDPGQERDGDRREPAEERRGPERGHGAGRDGAGGRAGRAPASRPRRRAAGSRRAARTTSRRPGRRASAGRRAPVRGPPPCRATSAERSRRPDEQPRPRARRRRPAAVARADIGGARRPWSHGARAGPPRYDASGWPSRVGRSLATARSPRPRPGSRSRRRSRGVMSTSPRKRPASEAIVAGGVVILLIAIVGLVFWSGAGAALYPPEPVTEEARRDQQPLRHRVRARGRDLRRGRGPDRLERPSLPAPAGRRRPPAADARQQPRRGALDAHPDRHRPVPVRDLVGHAPEGRRDQRAGASATSTSRPSPASSSGSSSTSTPPATTSRPRRAR